ncbi:MAG: E2 SUMO-conjugating protein ubc9 [Watsoniomyces obsoletus]|nr:MAG: E2 SUMO-conjugating protein ubc9 [Watsoniomyces obsoletus]
MNIDENTNPVEIPDFIDQEDLEELIARNMNGVSPISAPNMNHMPVSWMHESESRSNVTQEHQHEQYLHPHPHSEDDLYDQLFREVLDFEMEMEMGMGNAGRSYPETAVGYGANKMVDEEEQGEEEMMDMSNG